MKKRLHRLILSLVLIICLASPLLFNTYYNSSLSQNPVVLVVGDFSTSESFGSLVYHGVIVAHDKPKDFPRPIIHKVEVNDSVWEDSFAGSNIVEFRAELASLHERLLNEIVNSNVIAIISANTSQTVTEVLEVGRVFNIPVIIAVSSSTNVLNDYHGSAFRLMASDQKQAEEIKNWSKESGKRIALLYDQSRYGIGLRNNLMSVTDLGQMLPFALNTTTDVGGIIKYASDEGVQAWIVVGYRNEAIEFLGKLQAMKAGGNVLFSDGAYGEWLTKIPRNSDQTYFLSFPTVSTSQVSDDGGELKGYAVFGFDAYRLITSAMKVMTDQNQERKYLLTQKIREVAPRREENSTRLQYSFDNNGENVQAKFSVMELKADALP